MLTLEFRAMQVRILGAVSAKKLEPAAIVDLGVAKTAPTSLLERNLQ